MKLNKSLLGVLLILLGLNICVIEAIDRKKIKTKKNLKTQNNQNVLQENQGNSGNSDSEDQGIILFYFRFLYEFLKFGIVC